MRIAIVMAIAMLVALACEAEPTASPAPTNTPVATPTPAPTLAPTETPVPTPTEVPLEEVTVASRWVYLVNEYDYITPYVDSSADFEEFELTVIVDGVEHCNPTRVYGDEGRYEMSCGVQEVAHESVERVSVQSPLGDLRCRRNVASTAEESVVACAWR